MPQCRWPGPAPLMARARRKLSPSPRLAHSAVTGTSTCVAVLPLVATSRTGPAHAGCRREPAPARSRAHGGEARVFEQLTVGDVAALASVVAQQGAGPAQLPPLHLRGGM